MRSFSLKIEFSPEILTKMCQRYGCQTKPNQHMKGLNSITKNVQEKEAVSIQKEAKKFKKQKWNIFCWTTNDYCMKESERFN